MDDPGEPHPSDLLTEDDGAETAPGLARTPEVRSRDLDTEPARGDIVLDIQSLSVYFGSFRAVRGVTLTARKGEITALIGPSGCGKTTLLRSLNRMHDFVPGARVEGTLRYNGVDIYAPEVDSVDVRRRIGMVFQRPNPFPKSIYDNVAYGARIAKLAVDMDECVAEALKRAALWDEVKDRLRSSATQLSGGQQQRLCIARALAAQPDVILMDEPCSALDPVATMRVEDLMQQLKTDYTIVIVTHNMQQAARVSDMTAFFTAEVDEQVEPSTAFGPRRPATAFGPRRPAGILVEFDRTERMFTNPSDPRTESYVSGRFG